jgi:DNA segregation ATPase FtsK/SpoIIIE, S-DNA-T family
MARNRSARRSRGSSHDPFIPDLFTVGRFLVRPEIVGTLLVVLAAAVVPFLFPFAGLVRDARDGVVQALGVHVFTVTLVLASGGVMLAMRYTDWIFDHARHLVGVLLLLVFSAGLLGMWHPVTTVGSVDLSAHSAGGDLGVELTASVPATAFWLSTLPCGFALLWPLTFRRGLNALPGLLKRGLQALWGGLVGLGVHRAVGRMLRAAALSLWRALRPPRVNDPPSVAAALRVEDQADLEALSLSDVDEDDEEPAPRRRKPRGRASATQISMDIEGTGDWRHSSDGWQLPPISALLDAPEAPDGAPDNERRAELIVDTLASFGVDARVTQINEGPTVTQFGVEPGWDVRIRTVPERDASGQPLFDEDGEQLTRDVEVSRTRIRVNRITALQNDLALALATPALRIEAPVPGKSIVGIEVPNASAGVVTLRAVMESSRFQKSLTEYELPIALGSGVSGEPAVADLAVMPHLLIAGATGSGKSVCLNAIITCLLMNQSPEQLRLVLVDPKRVELSTFDSVPHLAFSKIVVDMDKVVGTLQAVIHEMESRYRRFAQAGVRNIKRYNEVTEHNKLPYWVTVIDELADLMMAAPYQVEQQLVRLAQLGRAAGIHLIIATQRPSVDVVTGLIKANFPTRIAFAMSSQVDSRTVLDQGGAEKLLGRGDMLYVPTDAQKPTRLQGVYVSDPEIESVVGFWCDGRFGELVPEKHDDLLDEAERELAEAEEPAEEDDPMMVRAIDLARESNRMSTSMLQRRLRIGYPRAARIMDDLELRGIVGPPDGSGGSREVLIDEAAAEAEAALPLPRTLAGDGDGL